MQVDREAASSIRVGAVRRQLVERLLIGYKRGPLCQERTRTLDLAGDVNDRDRRHEYRLLRGVREGALYKSLRATN